MEHNGPTDIAHNSRDFMLTAQHIRYTQRNGPRHTSGPSPWYRWRSSSCILPNLSALASFLHKPNTQRNGPSHTSAPSPWYRWRNSSYILLKLSALASFLRTLHSLCNRPSCTFRPMASCHQSNNSCTRSKDSGLAQLTGSETHKSDSELASQDQGPPNRHRKRNMLGSP